MSPKKTVLLVEDERNLLKMYDRKFTLEGFRVLQAENGKQALEIVKTEKPAVILLDIIMPELDGFQVLERLESNPETKDIPVILLTNLNQETDIARGMNLGAKDFLVKANFEPDEVVEKVKRMLG